jgi:alpha-ketoglutarate-dependent taurine dioxygenase
MATKTLNTTELTVEEQQIHHGSPFPLVLGCETETADLDDSVRWASEHRDELLRQAQEHGAILFRGFPMRTPEDFDRFIAAFEMENFPYEQSLSNAVRINYTPRVFSANEAPADVTIFLHHEMAQTPVFPGILFFCCQKPADSGGATPLCRSDILFEQMLQRCGDFAKACEQKGLKYSNVMPGENDADSGMGRSWQSTFRATDRDQAEQRMRDLGYSWEWMEDDCLRATTPVLPAVRTAANGRKTFFNQLIAAFKGWKDSRNDPAKSITFGDGTPLERDTVLLVADMAEALTFDVRWQQGDVALVDNVLAMHGRRTFEGKRKILASLATAEHHATA